ncbi:hypothetical protein FRC09_004963 [Ceratobasidium sp. 395]|nr:hypothetical protein FRC09_004963 [Ceratobasidium sp. 395]
MSKYIVISGAPTTRELRTNPAPVSQWRIIHPHNDPSTSMDVCNESITYGLPPEEGPSTMLWPNSQSQSQSQSQTQTQKTQPETHQTNPGDSLTSNSTASTVLEQPTFIRTFPTNTLDQSESLDTDSSSVINFPTFHFSLRALTPLRVTLTPAGRGSVRATLLVAVLEVDGPDPITTKGGQETHLLRLVVGEDDGSVGKLVAWGDTALEWGGAHRMPGLRRGDVVLLSGQSKLAHTFISKPFAFKTYSTYGLISQIYKLLVLHRIPRHFPPHRATARAFNYVIALFLVLTRTRGYDPT